MKNHRTYSPLYFALALLFLWPEGISAQDKPEPRLSVGYVKEGSGQQFIQTRARIREKKGYSNIPNLVIEVIDDSSGDEVVLAKGTTDDEGRCKIDLPENNSAPDTLYFTVRTLENDSYSSSEDYLEIIPAKIAITHFQEDSITYIKATLKNMINGDPIEDVELKFYVKRYFRPLPLGGDDYLATDGDGEASVILPADIPADAARNFVIGVMVDDDSSIGTVIQEETFNYGVVLNPDHLLDKRTMWSPRDHAPWWLLIFPNAIIIAVWGTLFYLLFLLYKIATIKY